MTGPAPSLWCGCPSGPPNVIVDSNGVEVCGRCTGAWALRAGERRPSGWGTALGLVLPDMPGAETLRAARDGR